MARSIGEIEKTITENLDTKFSLSTSSSAEWLLWVHCFAYCIHLFEITLDLFKSEIEKAAQKAVAGTISWYNDKCYEFQMGYKLSFNTNTGQLEYENYDETARIIKTAAVNTSEDTVIFRVATQDERGAIIPLNNEQLLNFSNYIDAIKFAGTRTSIISTTADSLRYDMTVYYDPVNPSSVIELLVSDALEKFKTSQRFGGIIYRHKFVETITSINGVITVQLDELSKKGAGDTDFANIEAFAYLNAGYFDYSGDCVLSLLSVNETAP